MCIYNFDGLIILMSMNFIEYSGIINFGSISEYVYVLMLVINLETLRFYPFIHYFTNYKQCKKKYFIL